MAYTTVTGGLVQGAMAPSNHLRSKVSQLDLPPLILDVFITLAIHVLLISIFPMLCLKLNSPKFDGTNPKLWIKHCDSYFDLYNIPLDIWMKLATINFTGTATFWMQTIEIRVN